MIDIKKKYSQLNDSNKRHIERHLNLLLHAQSKSTDRKSELKERLLKVSSWSKEDVEIFKKACEHINNWNISKW